MEDNSIRFAGGVSVKDILIRSYNGSELDITSLVQRIDIYEDIYSPFISVELSIVDTNAIISKMPIIGEEIIVLDITDGTGHGMNKKPMFVYKVKDHVRSGDRTSSYTICCISTEAVVDMNIRISKSFLGLPSDIAKQIVQIDGLGTDINFYSEPTKNRIQFISNYWSPVQIMKFLCNRAISQGTDSPSYVFYENIDGFNFVSMDFLVGQAASSKFTHSNHKNNDIGPSLERIRNIIIDEEFDYIERLSHGMYGNRLLQVNPFAKSYNYRYIDFIEQYNKYTRLNQIPLVSENATRRINSALVSKSSPSSSFSNMHFDGMGQWYQQRCVELATRNAQKMQIDVPGRFNVSVGHVTDLYIYSESPPNTESKERDLYSLLDKVHSGRHLITAIHRIITRTEGHRMSVEVSKDSMMEFKL